MAVRSVLHGERRITGMSFSGGSDFLSRWRTAISRQCTTVQSYSDVDSDHLEQIWSPPTSQMHHFSTSTSFSDLGRSDLGRLVEDR
ncbi:hypothetical protein M6B38_366510 [Iris pallida]|uniref:Uncharacterized protein n=1 Tax=Iris pallida TaxID=29817 RepID=A0AAX6GGM8_IRIPA|nr:hypothetical protein M6B38_197050 [Iris pallida]KAJ6827702.1 hypothetical protein M6B38_366510 [Iris pallida]